MMTTPAARRLALTPGPLAVAALRALGRLGFVSLAGFHIWLLGQHVVGGQAFEPATMVRWLLAVLVLVGFRALSRRGLPLFLGRRAVGLWLLVVIIHCSAAWEGGAAAALDVAIPESVTALAQLSVTGMVLGAVIAVILAQTARPSALRRSRFGTPVLAAGLPSTSFAFRFSPRPPPPA
jgi:hypothetical protein